MKKSFNILLELGDYDLYELLHEQMPPVMAADIRGLWKSLLPVSKALDTFHRVDKLGCSYLGSVIDAL